MFGLLPYLDTMETTAFLKTAMNPISSGFDPQKIINAFYVFGL
jgi:hypothetical protein